MKDHVGILGVGVYLPEGRMDAAEIAAKTMGKWTKEAIIEKLGIIEKSIPLEGDGTQAMGVYAARKAIESTGIDPLSIDLIVCMGEEWKEYPLTTSGIYIQEQIGALNAYAFDVQQRCCSTVTALKIAQDMLLGDEGLKRAMVVGGYRNGDFVDYADPAMSMMYNLSAGGGALILEKNLGRNVILGSHIMSDGSMARDAGVAIGGINEPINEQNLENAYKSLKLMAGEHMKDRLNEVSMPNWLQCIDLALEKSGKTRADLGYLAVLHFKKSMHDHMLGELGLSQEQTIYLDRYGHMGQVDQILSLFLGLEAGKIIDGTLVSMIAAGIGYAWAANVIQWGPVSLLGTVPKVFNLEENGCVSHLRTVPKVINLEQAIDLIESDMNIVSALAAAEPKMILSRLHEAAQRKQVTNVNVTTCLPMGGYAYFMNPAYKGHFHMDGWFYSPQMRQAHEGGQVAFVPNHLHFAGTKRLFHRKPHLFIGSATPIDKHGYLSLSLSATYERDLLEAADLVLLEINPNLPKTFGDTIIHQSEVDYMVPVDYPIPELSMTEPTEKDHQIGRLIAELVDDGSTIQLGIGGIPNAVTAALMSKKDLGVHTEMFTDGMVDLAKAGVITGKKKNLHRGKMVATFALGTQKLYDFIDENPGVLILDGKYVNDPYVIGQNDNMVSINTTLEIDLTGQCCSESIGHRQFSGTGGQADTAIGAQLSKNGKSIIALYASVMVKQADGSTIEKSKIVPGLAQGAAVSLSRNDVDYVVTEFGIASLRGTNVRERVERLIAIAAPQFREELTQEAHRLGILYP